MSNNIVALCILCFSFRHFSLWVMGANVSRSGRPSGDSGNEREAIRSTLMYLLKEPLMPTAGSSLQSQVRQAAHLKGSAASSADVACIPRLSAAFSRWPQSAPVHLYEANHRLSICLQGIKYCSLQSADCEPSATHLISHSMLQANSYPLYCCMSLVIETYDARGPTPQPSARETVHYPSLR